MRYQTCIDTKKEKNRSFCVAFERIYKIYKNKFNLGQTIIWPNELSAKKTHRKILRPNNIRQKDTHSFLLNGHIASQSTGIGADDAFIFVKVWNCAISERIKSIGGGCATTNGGCPITSTTSMASDASYRDTLAGLIDVTLTHAAISMGVTSLTTAVAFYVSFINSITAIKCFG